MHDTRRTDELGGMSAGHPPLTVNTKGGKDRRRVGGNVRLPRKLNFVDLSFIDPPLAPEYGLALLKSQYWD